jgi:D-apionolactonase
MIVRFVSLALLFLSGAALAAEPIPLQAGPLSMMFEPDTAMLRYVSIGEHKVLQAINAPVRNQFWGTVPPVVQNLKLQRRDDSFQLTFDVLCRQDDIDFFWKGEITGTAQGHLTFTFDGEARSTFLRNRIGFCVLHGPEAAGRPCVVTSVDGEAENGRFPTLISPHQPFKDIRSIAHEVSPGVWAKVVMEGDTFEMEDQRNWTDASYKTYCTPLALPYPVKVEQGTKIVHRIELSIDGAESIQRVDPAPKPVLLRVATASDFARPLPAIGLQVSSQIGELSDAEIERLRALQLSHLRVDITPAERSQAARLRRAAQQAERLGVTLHVGLHLGDNAQQELANLETALQQIPQPSHWLLLAADDTKVRATRAFLTGAGQRGKLGRGENTNFTELNRSRPDPSTIDIVAFGINPQIHAVDNLSIMETLPIQSDTVSSARQFTADRPLFIAPITLKPQALNRQPAADELPANVDPRQSSDFAAAWTVGSIKYLAEAGADSVTYYETVGWLGVMESAGGSRLPDQFPSKPGQLFPIYRVFRELAEFQGGTVRQVVSSDAAAVVGLALEKDGRRRVLIANLTPGEQTARLQDASDQTALRRLSPQDNDGPVKRVAADDGAAVQLSAYETLILDSR